MKLQLDTKNKIIRVEEIVNLGKLIETLKELLPNGKWEHFKLDTQTQINRTQTPIIIERTPYNRNDWRKRPWITYKTGNSNIYNY